MPASISPHAPSGPRPATVQVSPMLVAVIFSLMVSLPMAVAIISGWLSETVLLGLAAVVPIGLGVAAVVGTTRADRAASSTLHLDDDELWFDHEFAVLYRTARPFDD